MSSVDIKVDDKVDITDVVCPVTFVKTKVALEELEDGETKLLPIETDKEWKIIETILEKLQENASN